MFSAARPLIEVWMSQTQFAEMVSTLNCGSGTPCTIKYLNGKAIAECPAHNPVVKIDDGFYEKTQELTERMDTDAKEIKEILKKPNLNKADREAILTKVHHLHMEVRANLPYMKQCFSEAVSNTVMHAKGEIEAFTQSVITRFGLEGIKTGIQKLLPSVNLSKDQRLAEEIMKMLENPMVKKAMGLDEAIAVFHAAVSENPIVNEAIRHLRIDDCAVCLEDYSDPDDYVRYYLEALAVMAAPLDAEHMDGFDSADPYWQKVAQLRYDGYRELRRLLTSYIEIADEELPTLQEPGPVRRNNDRD